MARRAAAVPAFEVMDLLAAARALEAGRGGPGGPVTATSVCHLEVGQPSARPPRAVLDAARAALDGPLAYTDALGLPVLRERVSRWYGERHGLDVPADRVAVTTGASAGCLLTFLAAFDPGDRVVVTEPGYPCYRQQLEALGVTAVALRLGPADGFVPTPDALDRAVADGPVHGVVVASPSNPTGTVLAPAELDALAAWCDRRGARLVADEVYHGIVDGPPAPTAAGRDGAVVVQSWSKYFCLAGWRVGWLVLPGELVRPVERLAQHLYLAPPTLSQHAALAAFGSTDELDAHVARYAANRRALVSALGAAGVPVAPARGAFYVWADVGALIDRLGGDSRDLCRRWLDELAVAATPGVDFDPAGGGRAVRFSVAGAADEVAEAARRLSGWFAGR